MEFRYKHWCGREERGRTRAQPCRRYSGGAKYPSIFGVGVPIILRGAKCPRIFGMGVQDILWCQISCDTGISNIRRGQTLCPGHSPFPHSHSRRDNRMVRASRTLFTLNPFLYGRTQCGPTLAASIYSNRKPESNKYVMSLLLHRGWQVPLTSYFSISDACQMG